MFNNRAPSGRNNYCGVRVAEIRKKMGISQRALADLLQVEGLDLDKNQIQRMESGQRFVTDVELVILSRVLEVSIDELVTGRENEKGA